MMNLCTYCSINLFCMLLSPYPSIILYAVDGIYEREGKRTYLSMLIQVGIYVPLYTGGVAPALSLAGRKS